MNNNRFLHSFVVWFYGRISKYTIISILCHHQRSVSNKWTAGTYRTECSLVLPHQECSWGSSYSGTHHWRWNWQSQTYRVKSKCAIKCKTHSLPSIFISLTTWPTSQLLVPPPYSPENHVSYVKQVAQECAAVILLTGIHLWCFLNPHLSQGVL